MLEKLGINHKLEDVKGTVLAFLPEEMVITFFFSHLEPLGHV